MQIELYRYLYRIGLEKLLNEIDLHSSELDLWVSGRGISNSSGNLCLHIVGNLKHFIGFALGEEAYVRDREREFSAKGILKESLVKEIMNTTAIIDSVFADMTEKELEQAYPFKKFEEERPTEFLLVHALNHLNYHVGQINYNRKLLNDGQV